jgi:hypothetical protein
VSRKGLICGNSKYQTDDPSAFVPNGIIIGGQRFVQRYGTTAVNVPVIGYFGAWDLGFYYSIKPSHSTG